MPALLLLSAAGWWLAAASAQTMLSFPAITPGGQPVAILAETVHDGVFQQGLLRVPSKLNLAPGKWIVRLRQGPHFRAVEREFDIRAGGVPETVDFGPVNLERVVDLRNAGWYAGKLEPEPSLEAQGLDWTVPILSARDGQIGALGPRTEVPPGLDGLPSYATLSAWRYLGAATFAGSLHDWLPFDLGAARLVDGLNVTEGGERSLDLWSMLLDRGYTLAPIAGANGRLYVFCPDGLKPACIAAAVRAGRTTVSTGPTLVATPAATNPLLIAIDAWARQDQYDRLLRVELWAHGRVVATHAVPPGESQQHWATTLTWTPQRPSDWVAVRVFAESGWALSSAFFAEPPPPPVPPLLTHVKMVFPEVASHQQGMIATVWPVSPSLPGARLIRAVEMDGNSVELDAPVTALVRVDFGDGRRFDARLPEATGVGTLLEAPGQTLLDWSLYEEVLRRCRRVVIESRL
jgi:hypothetical protein